MADYGFNTDLGPKAQQGMSLGDMVQLARGVQAYQQAEQLNPLALQKAKEEVTQAQTGTKEKQLGFTQKQQQMIFDELGTLKTDSRWINAAKDKKGAIEALMEREDRLKNLGIDPALLRSSAAPMYQLIEQKPQLATQVVDNIINKGGNEKQFSQLNQAPQFVNTGAGIVPVYTSPFQGGGPGKTPTLGQYLAPTVATSETGAPMIIGGGKGAGVVNQQPQQDVTEPITPIGSPNVAPQTKPNAAAGLNQSFNAKGGLQRAPDETYDAYKARVARLSALPTAANNALNLGNVESIPNMELTNNRILKLIEDKNVNIGPVANAIANKTGGVGLTSEQQEVMKYLEQRIRQEGARSNQDQASQSKAYGSFGTNKEALRDILYNDKALLASQRLLYKGIKNHQGNPNQPNLGAINAFENSFNDIAQNPDVMHLIGVVGNKSMEDLSATDRQHLKKYFKGKSQEYIDSIFEEKDKLEKLVGGK